MDKLAPIIGVLSQNYKVLFLVLAVLLALFFLLRWMPRRAANPMRGSRRAAARSKRGERWHDSKRAAIRAEEFQAAVGQTRSRYTLITLMVTGIIALLVFVFLGSWSLTLISGGVFYRWWMGRANGKVSALRSGLSGEEMLPAARQLSGSLNSGMSLAQSLADLLRGGQDSGLKRSVRRALADSRGLEEGLREEEHRAQQDMLREFFEILTDGATAARNATITAETLDKYADINQRRRNRFQLTMRVTAQARGSRSMLLAIVPFMYGLGVMISSSELMLHTLGGNIITLLIVFLLGMATLITNRIINGATKGF